jgi:HD-like signal output (HDOD) protein
MADKQKPVHPRKALNLNDKRLARLLLEEGVVKESRLQGALQAQADNGGRLLDCLLEKKVITSDNLHAFLSTHSGAPSIDVRNYEIPREVAELVPAEFAREHSVMPIDKMGKLMTVGMANPMDTDVIAEIERLTGLRVKPMLCKSDDIRAKIKRSFPQHTDYSDVLPELKLKSPPVKTPATKPPADNEPARVAPSAPPPGPRMDLAEALERLAALAPMPGTVKQIQSLCDDGKSFKALSDLAEADPAVAAALLRLANTQPYGMPGRVGNIPAAVALLGVKGATGAMDMFAETGSADTLKKFDYTPFWTRSMFCAAAAMAVVKEKGGDMAADAYAAGLLHDVGWLALACSGSDETAGIGHEEAGYLLARQWRFPQTITLPIRFHHAPHQGAEGELVAEIALGAAMAESYLRGTAMTAESFEPHAGLLSEAGLDATRAAKVYAKVSNSIRGAKKAGK